MVVYPDELGRLGRRLLTWNAEQLLRLRGVQIVVDSVAFALAVLRDVARNVSVDPARRDRPLNGAMMAYRVAIEASERIHHDRGRRGRRRDSAASPGAGAPR